MDGVTILKEYAWRDLSLLTFLPSMILLVALLIILCVNVYEYIKTKYVGMALLIGALAFVIKMYESCQPTYTRYVVTVDDSVNFNEFANRYEIISNDGAMYTVQERE